MSNPYEAPRSALADPAPGPKAPDGKLPVRLQLVLLTAAVIFAFSSIRMIGGIRGVIYSWTTFPEASMSVNVYLGVGTSVLLVVASFVAFVRILRGSATLPYDIAVAYLALLVVIVGCQFASWWVSGAAGIERVELGPDALRWTKLWYLLRFVWPTALLLLVVPNSRFRMPRGQRPEGTGA